MQIYPNKGIVVVMNKFYLTTAIPYVNAAPHIGHALEFVQADVVSRFHRQIGDETCLLTGSDENSLKNVLAAEKEGITTQELCNNYTKKFQSVLQKLNVKYDYYQRGSSRETHFTGSQKLWNLCFDNGDIYKKNYKGLYCVGCEAFYTQEELTHDGECPEHLKKPELVEEENYFFKLSKYQNFLEDLISTDKLKIFPQSRKNEVLSFIRMGLNDFSVSRSKQRARNWGVPVPNDETQIIYVWFDALNIYQTGIGFGSNDNEYQKWWPADLHIIGKGITRFHAIYWPAILKSADLALPKSILVHGYLTVDGQKISKTLGNVIDPNEIIDTYGVDPVRYYLLREIPPFSDGDFSQNRFKELYNADLANGLGNLVARVAKLAEKISFKTGDNKQEFYPETIKELGEYRFDHALEFLWQKIKELDLQIEKTQPWKLENKALSEFIAKVVPAIQKIAFNLTPFLPETAEKILSQYQGKIISQPALFPRIASNISNAVTQ